MRPPPRTTAAALILTAASIVVHVVLTRRKQRKRQRRDMIVTTTPRSSAYEFLIGNTPLVKLERLSQCIGRSVYVKMESLNPGATGKDRAALSMIQHAEQCGDLPPPVKQGESVVGESSMEAEVWNDNDNSSLSLESKILHEAMQRSRSGGLVVEGTSGSTGISLATLCVERGHACLVVLPDDQASEKKVILTTLFAIVHVVPNCAISHPNHYVNVARRLAEMARTQYHMRAVFIDQFDNQANFHVHYTQTGPELWQQCRSCPPDAFVMSSGTGGTLAGVGTYLKERSHGHCRVVLVDPPGSALYNRVRHGVVYAPQQRERAMKRHRYDTLAEGIGLDRMTRNFSLGIHHIDDAVQVTDQEAVDMAHWLLKTEGLWVGSSSAMNVVGAIRVAAELKPNSNVVTVICDTGQRHVTRFWNPDFIKEWGLEWPGLGGHERIPECLQSYYAR